MTLARLRLVLFLIVAIVQLAVAGAAIFKSELALQAGEVFKFRVQPVDPVDAFRGRYVAVRSALDRAPVEDGFEVKPGRWIFVPLHLDDEGFAAFGMAGLGEPDEGAFLKLRSGGIFTDEDGARRLSVSLTPFGRYYMDEKLAPEAERAVWGGPRGEREAFITVRVRNGTGVLEDLWIDGIPIHEWLAANSDPP